MVSKQQKQFVKSVEQQCSKLAETNNFGSVFKTFRRNYHVVPLEVFGNNPYKTLISTILSSRTKDEVTLEASKRLFLVAKDLEQLGKLEIKEIQKLIYPVGFYKTKAKQLCKLSRSDLTRKMLFKGPTLAQTDLMKLPGVGRKTANLVLNRAFGIPAIAVDTHVHRISNFLGWVKTKTPEQTEKELNKILPRKYWPELNRLFVSIGRQYTTNKKLGEFLKKVKIFNISRY